MKDGEEIYGDFPRERINRRDLTRFKLQCEWLAQRTDNTPSWRHAYLQLAHAADHLDALICRAMWLKQRREAAEGVEP